MKRIVLATVLVIITVVSSQSVSAADNTWVLRLNGGWMESSAQLRGETDLGTFTATVEGSPAFSIGVEYRFSERLGVEVSLLRSSVDIGLVSSAGEWSASDTVSLDVTPLTLAFNLHLAPRSSFDLYLSPSISHVGYGDFVYAIPEEGIEEPLDVDNETFAFGLGLGIDVPFGSSGWSFNGQVRTVWTEAYNDDWIGVEPLSIDPLLVLVGVSRRF